MRDGREVQGRIAAVARLDQPARRPPRPGGAIEFESVHPLRVDITEEILRGDRRSPVLDPHGDRAEIGHQRDRSEEHTSELQSLMRISYAVFCLKKKKTQQLVTQDNTYNYQKNTKHTTNK